MIEQQRRERPLDRPKISRIDQVAERIRFEAVFLAADAPPLNFGHDGWAEINGANLHLLDAVRACPLATRDYRDPSNDRHRAVYEALIGVAAHAMRMALEMCEPFPWRAERGPVNQGTGDIPARTAAYEEMLIREMGIGDTVDGVRLPVQSIRLAAESALRRRATTAPSSEYTAAIMAASNRMISEE